MEENKPLVEFIYSVPIECEEFAFSKYQQKNGMKKKIILTLVLILAIVFYIQAVYVDGSYTVGKIMIVVAFAILASIWINPILIKKNLMKALIKLEKDKTSFKLYDDRFSIKITEIVNQDDEQEKNDFDDDDENDEEEKLDVDKIEPYICLLDEKVNIYEYKKVFIIMQKKAGYYVLPKIYINDEMIKTMREIFTKNIGKNFSCKVK